MENIALYFLIKMLLLKNSYNWLDTLEEIVFWGIEKKNNSKMLKIV